MPEQSRIPPGLAPEDASLSPSESLRPRDSGRIPGRSAFEATLGAIGAGGVSLLERAGAVNMSAPATASTIDLPDYKAPHPTDVAEATWSIHVPGWTRPGGEALASVEPSPFALPQMLDGQGMQDGKPAELARSYVPIEEIGRGGMGVVHRARQTVLHRDIAVKSIRVKTNERRALAFISEALITASLEHPNIIPVYDLTLTPNRRLALAMKLVGGTNWRNRLVQRGNSDDSQHEALDLEYHLNVLLSVANALAFAHSKHIAHCDVKPSNVLLGEFGEVLLVDWGVAVDFHSERRPQSPAPHRSSIHTPCGTPQYMAPELARGAGDEIGPWTDVFLLGAVLYEILTGAPPHRGSSAAEVLWRALKWDRPNFERSAVIRDIPEQLVVICERALARAPEQRYQTVAALQEDVRAFLGHRESVLITRLADEKLATCRALSTVSLGNPQGRSRLYSEFADAVAGFRQARVLWPYNPRAIRGERDARVAFARSALAHNDLGLAEAQLELLDGSHADADNLRASVTEAWRAERRARHQTRWLRTAVVISVVVVLLGLGAGWVLIDQERERALDSRNLAERRLADIRRLADVQHLARLQADYHALWPAVPDNAEQMAHWIDDAVALAERLPDHQAYLNSLRARAERVDDTMEGSALAGNAATSYRFTTPAEQWEHDNLARLVSEIGALQADFIPSMIRRETFARSVYQHSIVDHSAAWDQARAAIAASPHYRGLELAPQLGLIPIGPDPRTGFWEFAHIQSGEIPRRGPDGFIERADTMSIVLVLLPGGQFTMGAKPPSRTEPIGQPNVDPRARPSEGPVHTVALAPFFMSKYELTQGQWTGFTDANPAAYPPGKLVGHRVHSALHPVEMIRWRQANQVAMNLGLTLPTEAQWEYAARAGTTTVYASGDDDMSLRGTLNIADAYCRDNGGPGSWHYVPWLDDGYVVHAPVGSYQANQFGLHDMAGNVWEWCLDRYGDYTLPVRADTGERMAPKDAAHVFRGGGFRASVVHARAADRYTLYTPGYRGYDVGVRMARLID